MKKRMMLLALMGALSVQFAEAAQPAAAPGPLAPLSATPTQGEAALWASRVLTRYHYEAVPLDAAMSDKIFDRYIKALDPDKLFFVQADIDQFAAVRSHLDSSIEDANLSVPFTIFNLYQQRFEQRIAYARSLLKGSFDFTRNETYQADRTKAAWATSEAQANDLWRKRVENDWLRLQLAGKDAAAIRTTLDKRYDTYLSGARKLKNEDAFEIFLDSYAMSTDPHTNYLGPSSADQFDIAMRLSLVGIGCVLESRDEYTLIREVVPGTPAAKSGKLKVGDRIIGVAEGATGPFVDVLGWRIDDVLPKIRGAKDSLVRLEILPAGAGPDGKPEIVPLVRQKISMEEQSAKKTEFDVRDHGVTRRVGVLTLPAFYQDFDARGRGDKQFKSATRDVAKLLAQMKQDKVETLLIDLRGNGGGSLDEAVSLTGLFIDQGPVVQQRNADGKIDVLSDTNPGVAWSGPMGVLINRGSASASEIFAAAIQDYGRGVIIGEPSFGKGTVQTVVDLNRFGPAGDKSQYGELKMTIAQFFRINGGTTQLHGVTPDVKFPTLADSDTFGESTYDNALPYSTIPAATYGVAGSVQEIAPLLQQKFATRSAADTDFTFLQQGIELARKERLANAISLNEATRRSERDVQDARAKQQEQRMLAALARGSDLVQLPDTVGSGKAAAASAADAKAERIAAVKAALRDDDGLQGDERSLTAEVAAEKAAKSAPDILLDEAVYVMSDEAAMLAHDKALAARVLPPLPASVPEASAKVAAKAVPAS